MATQCPALGGNCQATGPHTEHWFSTREAMRRLGITERNFGLNLPESGDR